MILFCRTFLLWYNGCMTFFLYIQARLHSRRLPQKVLLRIAGKSIFELLVERMERAQGVDEVVLVTGPKEKNFALVQEAERLGTPYFCGSEENVLDRFYQASLKFPSDAIIRITGDNPLMDPNIVSDAIMEFEKQKPDILQVVKNYPVGMGFEIFTNEALQKAWQENSHEEQFVNPVAYMLESGEFKKVEMACSTDLSAVRVTIDTEEDFEKVKKIFETLYVKNPNFGLDDILKII